MVVTVDLFRHDYDGVAAIGRFWDEKNDFEHKDTKKDGAHAEGPSVAIVLDDVAAYQSASRNSGEKKEVPHSDSRSSFVNKVEISNGTLDQDFVERHANFTNYATRGLYCFVAAPQALHTNMMTMARMKTGRLPKTWPVD